MRTNPWQRSSVVYVRIPLAVLVRVVEDDDDGAMTDMEVSFGGEEQPVESDMDEDDSESDGETNSSEKSDAELQGVAVLRPARLSKLSWTSCLCCAGDVRGEKAKDFTLLTWRVLHNAAELRRDATYFFLLDNKTVCSDGTLCPPKGVYHSVMGDTPARRI